MLGAGVGVAVTVAIWWGGTVAILYLDGLRRSSFRISMLCASGLLLGALFAISALRSTTSTLGAYAGFGAGVLVWVWVEISFLLGFITGPRKRGCAPGSAGLPRFLRAAQAILYHEMAAILAVILIVYLSAGAANRTALGVIGILWVLRLSAKLNLFLGVRNTSEELLPAHLRYIGSYFRHRNCNALFPLSILGMLALIAALAHFGLRADASDFEQLQSVLLIALAGLGLLEHLLMVVPINSVRFWSPGLLSRQRAR